MDLDRDELVRDALPVNAPYDGVVAEAYDVWLPPDGNYEDREPFRRLVRDAPGPALELGCGNGRLLAGYVAAGYDVEGVDSSADMLAICRAHMEAAGGTATLHHADWRALDLDPRYALLYNPAGSFALLHDEDEAKAALATWIGLLVPGGRLALSLGVPPPERGRDWVWRVRRSGTRAVDGVTFVVHQATRRDDRAQVHHTLDRHEVWAPDGTLRLTRLRRHCLRWWTPAQIVDALGAAGFADVETVGSDAAYLAFGTRR